MTGKLRTEKYAMVASHLEKQFPTKKEQPVNLQPPAGRKQEAPLLWAPCYLLHILLIKNLLMRPNLD